MFSLLRMALLACCLLAPAPVLAQQTMKLPKSAPLITVDLPEKWVMHTDNDEFDASSPDQKLYLRFSLAHSDALDERITKTFAVLARNHIKVNQGSMKQSSGTVNGFAMTESVFDASDAMGPASVRLTLFAVAADKFVVRMIWCTPEGEAAWSGKLADITNSLRYWK